MKLIGLTGPTAVGKSLVTSFLEELGEAVIDVDVINRNLQNDTTSPVFDKIETAFPEVIIDTHGYKSINRKKLSEIVFGSRELLTKLEGIMKPHIDEAVDQEIIQLGQRNVKFAFYCHPLLLTSGEWMKCCKFLYIDCYEELQLSRLMKRNNLSKEDALIRMKLQDQSQKKYQTKISSRTIYNIIKEDTLRQVHTYVAQQHLEF